MKSIEKKLKELSSEVSSVVPFDMKKVKLFVFDFSEKNKELAKIDLSDTDEFTKYIFNTIKENNAAAGIGGYGENRTIYKRSNVFAGDEPRTIHLGIDIWANAGTDVYAPLDGRVHSFKNNNSFGDYGPTIVLQHNFDEISFYTLYGHLNIESLKSLNKGMIIKKGEKIAELGTSDINVQWPPHLHFQIIKDMMGNEGDFPGVAAPSKKEFYLENSPDPNLLFNLKQLKRS